jgi:uncharacterized membrane protein YhaH (DUF805 family)
MDFGTWYLRRGRISRRTYWLHYVLPLFVVSLVASIIDAATGSDLVEGSNYGLVSAVVAVATIVPSISSNVTRLHDRDHSAWWLLWYLLPVIGWLLLLVQIGFLPGTPGGNSYGPPEAGPEPLAEPGYPPPYA